MQCIVVGHGSHDGTEKVVVPEGVQLDFFTREDTPMLMSNLLYLLAGGDLGIPMDSAVAGRDDLPNYTYGSFTDEQLARALQVERSTVPVFFAGSPELPQPCALCTGQGVCPPDGPHTCTGILGFAAREGYKHVQILACRVNTEDLQPPTEELMNEEGVPDRGVYGALEEYVHGFVGLPPEAQDAEWESLDYDHKVYLASDGEIAQWAEVYEARSAMRAADPVEAAGILAALDPAIRLRLLRDYPDYRHLLQDNVALSPEERAWVAEQFLPGDFDTQVAYWRSLDDQQQLRYLTDPGVASWTTAYNAWEYFMFGMAPAPLADLIGRLDVDARAVLRQRDDIRQYLGASSAVLD
jgi:hypothetical protein